MNEWMNEWMNELSKYNFNNMSIFAMFILGGFTCLTACQYRRGIFTYTRSCSSCVCVCVCGKKTWIHLQEHVNTSVQVTCYVLKCIRPFMPQDALKSAYCSYFHSLITYGIIFWGNSSYSSHIFWLQKKAVRLITGSRPRDSCREMFKHLRILPLQSQYILSLLLFVMDNKNLFHVNSEIHSINTRQNSNLHQPQANLMLYQKGAYYSGIKDFNNLPHNIRNLSCMLKDSNWN